MEDILGADWQLAEMFNAQRFANLIIAAYIAILAFRASINKLAADFAPTEQPPKKSPDTNTDKYPNRSTLH
jgi:hypothetical protein